MPSQIDLLHAGGEPHFRAQLCGDGARQRLDAALPRIPERRIVSHVFRGRSGSSVQHVLERRSGDEPSTPLWRELLAWHRVELLVVGEHEVPREPFAEVAEDELRRIGQRARTERFTAGADSGVDEAEDAVRDRPRRQTIQMELVRKRGPNAFTVDPRAPLHVEQVSAQPAPGDQIAHLRIARVQPVAGPIEREAFDHFGAAEPADPVFGLEQRARAAELPRAREAGEAAADHDGSPTPAHKHPPVP